VTASAGGNWSHSVTSSEGESEIVDSQPGENSPQIVTSLEWGMRSQIVTSSQKKRKLGLIPYAFTEHDVSMLASVFHDVQLNGIYKAIENLLHEKAEKKAEEQKWMDRERIGFRS